MNKMQGKITIAPTTKITGSIKSSMIYPALEDLKVKSSSETQHFKSKAYGFNNVTVEPVVELKGDTLTVSPSTSAQKIVPKSPANGFTEVNVNAVTADIDSNIVPENIANGVEILGVKGDFKGKPETNVFMQETEPEKKDGIWLQGNYEVENIIADTNIFTGEEWNTAKTNSLKSIPYAFHRGGTAIIDTDVYLFGGSGANTTAYKYDMSTDTYTKLSNIPYNFYNGSAVAVGTDVYLFGGGASVSDTTTKYAYKYDTLTDTYTKLTNIPYSFYTGGVSAVGTNIYLFGLNSSYTYAYKYDTLTGSYSTITNVPYDFRYGECVVAGTNIYLFGGCANTTSLVTAYRYDTLTNKYTKLKNIPYNFYKGSLAYVGTNIYLFGGANDSFTAYKYDILSNNYTKLPNIKSAFRFGGVTVNGIDIYLFGGTDNTQKVQVMSIISKDYPNKSIIIAQDINTYLTNIADIGISNLKTYYDKVYYNDNNGQINSIPTYNGNGTSWTRI